MGDKCEVVIVRVPAENVRPSSLPWDHRPGGASAGNCAVAIVVLGDAIICLVEGLVLVDQLLRADRAAAVRGHVK